jgi:serine/threonine-protein kinase
MIIAPGSRLGPYDVLSLLGRGGMGEVYRARDARLGRDVAIKVLPPALAADADRRARFEREAQVLASLNHPNIAAVYGLEEADGRVAIVLELVEGPTLEERIVGVNVGSPERPPVRTDVRAHGSVLPRDEAILIARQIVDALEAAHEKGIIHRDLKPANIKLSPDGRVKVLDFGLAKALAPVLSGVDQENSPTLTTPAMTAIGMLLGTAAYMSPEQARGLVVDKRADIWAFGVVLFEMLTGGRLFHGATVSDTIAGVLRQEIDWRALPAGTPPSIESLLRRCLDRDPKRRLRDIGEARLALEAATREPVDVARAEAPPVAAPKRRYGLVHLAAAGLLLALLAAIGALWVFAGASNPLDARLSVSLPSDLTFNLANRPVVAISHDGTRLAIVAQSKGVTRLYVRPIQEFDLRLLAGTEGASGPFFSPDGAWIGFFADGKIKKVRADGGPVVTLADAADPRNAVWTAGDLIFYTPQSIGPVYKIPAAGGSPEPIATLDARKQERTHRWPAALPDGNTILFTVGSVAHPDDYDDASIEAVRLKTGTRHVVVPAGRMASYVSTGHLLYVRGRLLYAVPFDAETLQVRGMAVPVVDGVSGDTTTGAANYAVSASGTLAYVPGDPAGADRRIGWVDMKGASRSSTCPPPRMSIRTWRRTAVASRCRSSVPPAFAISGSSTRCEGRRAA